MKTKNIIMNVLCALFIAGGIALIRVAFLFEAFSLLFYVLLTFGIFAFWTAISLFISRLILTSFYSTAVVFFIFVFPFITIQQLLVYSIWYAIFAGVGALIIGSIITYLLYKHLLKPIKVKRNLFLESNKFLFKFNNDRSALINKKNDRAFIYKDSFYNKVLVEKCVIENGVKKYIVYKKDYFNGYETAYFFAVKWLIELYRQPDDRPEKSLFYDMLTRYRDGLNKLLTEEDFNEQFVLEKDTYCGTEYEKLVLYHQTDSNCKIEFIPEYNGVMYFLGICVPFVLGVYEQENIDLMFDWLKKIITDKVVVMKYYDPTGQILLAEGLISLVLDPNSFEYTDMERDILTKQNFQFSRWSGFVPTEHKLLVIAFFFTQKPDIIAKWKEQEIKDQEEMEAHSKKLSEEWDEKNILWKGSPSKKGVLFMTLTGFLKVALVFMILAVLGLLVDLTVFLICEGIALELALFSIPFIYNDCKKTLYIIVKDAVIFTETDENLSLANPYCYSFDRIIAVKVKYSLYNKDRSHGTIKFTVRGAGFPRPLVSVPNPEEVCKIIEDARNAYINNE